MAYYFATPLLCEHGKNKIPEPLMKAVFDKVVSPSQRQVTTDAPETVEIVLRAQGGSPHPAPGEHGTGRAPGMGLGGRSYVNLSALPAVPACAVRVRLDHEPASVTLQPQNIPLADWHYQDGIVTATVPSFPVHQMVVFQ